MIFEWVLTLFFVVIFSVYVYNNTYETITWRGRLLFPGYWDQLDARYSAFR